MSVWRCRSAHLTHTHTISHTLTCTHTHTHAHTCTHMHTHAHACTHTHALTHMHSHTHTHSRTHTHAHAPTHKYIYMTYVTTEMQSHAIHILIKQCTHIHTHTQMGGEDPEGGTSPSAFSVRSLLCYSSSVQ